MSTPPPSYPIVAQAWLGDTLGWVDMPLRTEAGGGGVTIKRDRKPGAPLPDPGTCSLVVDDTASEWNPRNPRGPYFGLIGRNTPIRVSFDDGVTWRFCGEAARWSPSWSVSEQDRTVSIEVAGVLRRLLASDGVAQSPMRRTYGAAGPVAYWPMEDGVSATQIGSALPGHPPAVVDGVAAFVDVADYSWGTADYQTIRFGVGKVVELKSGASVRGVVPGDVTAATSSAWTAFVSALTDYNFTSGEPVLLDVATPGGTFTRWQLIQRELAVSGVSGYELVAYDQAGTATSLAYESGVYLSFIQLSFSVWQDGSLIRAGINGGANGFTATGSATGTLTGVTSVAVNPTRVTSTAESMPFAHLALFAAAAPPEPVWGFRYNYGGARLVYGAYLSHWRETATQRLARLCAEQGVPLTAPAIAETDDVELGWQSPGTWQELITGCIDADGGVLTEQRDGIGLVYRPRATLYNAAPVATLSYAAGHIAPPFRPVDDDDQVANDITVERIDGSSVRAVADSGPLSILPPPDGIGTYEGGARLPLLADAQLADHAYWRLHVGTVPDARYDQVAVRLDADELVDDPALAAAVAAADGGDLVQLVELPDWLPPGPVLVRVEGYEESADTARWSITFTASPGSPWTVATADGEPRAPADGTVLQNAVTAGALSLSITSTAANGPWVTGTSGTNPTDFPLDVLLTLPGAEGTGELVRLSGIAGTGLTQTATVAARALNGVSRAWPAGALVDVADVAVAPL